MVSRVSLRSDDELGDELISAIRARLGPDSAIPNLYRALGNAPAMLDAWIGFAWSLRLSATAPRPLRELVILRVAQLLDAHYEWHHHVAMAMAAGVPDRQVDDLHEWFDSDAFDRTEQLALQMTDQLTRTGEASAEVVEHLRARCGEEMTVELVLTAAFYNCVARVLRSLAIPLEDAGQTV